MCVCVCVRARVCVCVCTHTHTHTSNDVGTHAQFHNASRVVCQCILYYLHQYNLKVPNFLVEFFVACVCVFVCVCVCVCVYMYILQDTEAYSFDRYLSMLTHSLPTAQFTCFTSTKAQILMQKLLQEAEVEKLSEKLALL